ncbi:hypothetical protein C8Q80DRAFT_1191421 [Daedaleopsis nitida]|nr:hypothetical protein C8Q80DRAFT_1191421 [Daedaleopsis nitida]
MTLRYPSPTLSPVDTRTQDRPRTVYNTQAVSLNTTDSLLDISSRANTGRVRLLDCLAFLDQRAIQIVEFPELPTIAYSVISYPWCGVSIEATSETSGCGHRFAVDGATDADPIGLIPLQHACIASVKQHCLYIWMDKLSIIQTSQEDKDWHVKNMIGIYQSARLCIVLPGGAQRLVRLNEETTWIYRSWTLPEALAPAEVVVLVEWKLGTGRGAAGTKSGAIQEVVPGQSMVAPLVFLLHAGAVGHCSFVPKPPDGGGASQSSRPGFAPVGVQVSIFGAFPTGRASDGTPFWKLQHKICASSIMALVMAIDTKGQTDRSHSRAHAVWQSALMRTASRPVDMVYSVMGLFDVSLDPAAFAPDDLRGASIALAQAILKTGQSATWLGAAFGVEPMATLPTFPSANVEGGAFVQTKDGLREVDAVVRSPVRLYDTMPFQPPEGVMDDAGQFTLTARAMQLRLVTEDTSSIVSRTIDALDGSRWVACVPGESWPSDGDSTMDDPRRKVYGAVIGWFDQDYSSMTSSFRNDTIRAMLLEECAPRMLHLRSFFCLSWSERDNVETWPEMEFRVTGDGPPPNMMSTHRFKPELEMIPEPIYAASSDALKLMQVLSISEKATPCRIRLVDCEALVEHGLLKIVEFSEFPTVPYSAISYPWLGVAIDATVSVTSFSVEGAEHADPVGIDVLTHACTASLMRGCPYLWLDRLCIIQNNREDKNWQIQHMYQVYKSCRLCVVLAGGIRRLVRLDEPNPWIHRSWTLQEVLAPPEAVVLFAWKLGWGLTMSSGLGAPIQEVVPNESAIATLSVILEACSGGTLAFTPATLMTSPYGDDEVRVSVSLFSTHPSASAAKSGSVGSRIFAPNVVALAIAMEPTLTTDPDTRAHAAWQSALMRTSSRPVDMVFSIMGLFGVTLDVGAFDKDDRRGVTIALAQAILEGGGSASWLGAAARITPDRCLSTFPRFPRTSVAGAAMVRVGTGRRSRMQEVSQVVDHPVYPVRRAIGPLPKGRMDSGGYLTFTVRAVPLQADTDPLKEDESGDESEEASSTSRVVETLDRSRWVLAPGSSSGEGGLVVYGALLGWFDRYFPGSSPAAGPDNIMVMVLEEHRPGIFHLRSFFHLGQKDRETVLAWGEREFTVGGPDALGSATPELLPTSTANDVDQLDHNIPVIHTSGLRKALEDEIMEQARRAIPQLVLERHREEALGECTDEYFVWSPLQI